MHESAGQARGTGGQDLRRVETPPAMHASTRIGFPIFQLIYNACFGTRASRYRPGIRIPDTHKLSMNSSVAPTDEFVGAYGCLDSSQIRTVWSPDPDTSRVPSALKATA